MTTVRTIKLKRNPQLSADAPAATPPPAQAAPDGSVDTTAAETMASSMPEPTPVPAATVSAKSYMPFTLCAAAVVLFFLVIMGLQYSEISHYQAEPSVWVKK